MRDPGLLEDGLEQGPGRDLLDAPTLGVAPTRVKEGNPLVGCSQGQVHALGRDEGTRHGKNTLKCPTVARGVWRSPSPREDPGLHRQAHGTPNRRPARSLSSLAGGRGRARPGWTAPLTRRLSEHTPALSAARGADGAPLPGSLASRAFGIG